MGVTHRRDTSPTATGLLRPILRGQRVALARLLLWSLLGVTPVVLSGRLVAVAIDQGFLAGSGVFGLAMLGIYGLTMVVGTLANRQAIRPMAAIVETVRNQLLQTSVHGGVVNAVLDGRSFSTGAVSRITSQVEKVRQLLSGLLLSGSSVGFTAVAAVVGLVSLTPWVGLVMAPVTALAVGVIVQLSRVWKRRYERSLASEEALGEQAGDTLNGLRDVFACSAVERAAADLDRACLDNAAAAKAVADIGGARVGVIGLGARAPLVLLLLLAPWLISTGRLSPGELLGAATYVMSGLEPALRMLVHTVGNMGLELSTVLGRLVRHSTPPAQPSGGAMALDRYDLELQQVTFRYGTHSQPVLERTDLRIGHGEHLTVVGPSGIGKSTLVNVLAGLEQVESGTVLLGGVSLGGLREPWLRSTIALIPQQAYVFAGSLRENLRYLAPHSTEQDLDRTVFALGLEDLVHMCGGYDGRLRSDELSEGQKQLVALARVHMSAARIVILDEATCHLDAWSEEHVERAFARRAGTLIVIAHRISSALRSDRVLLLDNQGIQAGTHGMLLQRSSTYANLVGAWQAAA